MAAAAERAAAPKAGDYLRLLTDLLGGRRVLGRDIQSPLDAHDILLVGLPATAFDALVNNLVVIDTRKSASFYKAIGMSLRTHQRHKDVPAKALSLEQSGRAWKFAEILAKATQVFGSQAEAEQWLDRPAIGLDQHRPIDLLTTPAGLELVEDYLSRLEYGVYT
jgi:putative toxin-antitoxin system antitoxin component (TIGR02293 family)